MLNDYTIVSVPDDGHSIIVALIATLWYDHILNWQMDIIMADTIFADKWPSVFSSWRRFKQKTIFRD